MTARRLLVTAFLMVVGATAIAALDAEVDLSPLAALLVTGTVSSAISVYLTWDQLRAARGPLLLFARKCKP